MNENILKAIAVTAELTGTELSRTALIAMESDLAAYPEQIVLRALDRCRKELKSRLTPAAVIERIESCDGRPTANEAWGLALKYFDESQTVIVNDEIREACSIARPVIEFGDDIGARMAFRDAYERIVSGNRQAGKYPTWSPSLGDNKDIRQQVLSEAVERGLLTQQQIAGLLPAPVSAAGAEIAGLLIDKTELTSSDIKDRIQALRDKLNGRSA